MNPTETYVPLRGRCNRFELKEIAALHVLSRSKHKAVPLHAMVALGGERSYSSYSFLTSAVGRASG
jgi:hypothetical protein